MRSDDMSGIMIYILIMNMCLGCTQTPADKPSHDENLNVVEIESSYSELNKDIVLGKIEYRKDSNFVKLSSEHTSKDIYLHRETYLAFQTMFDKARTDGVALKVISGTRDFYHQKSIWDRKWKLNSELEPYQRAKKILEFSSMPGTSRHHWGTDLDINDLNDEYFLSGKGAKEYDWLVQNANDFGFYQVYTKKDEGRTGYNEEKWHWSYMPLASQYLAYYNENINYSDIAGFEGANLADSCQMISDYVNGISLAAKSYKAE